VNLGLRLIPFVGTAILLTGCAGSQGSIKVVGAPPPRLTSAAPFTGVSLQTTTRYGLTRLTDADRARILSLVTQKLQEKAPGRFKAFNPPATMPDVLQATIAFREYDEGNAFARFMLAGLGQMRIAADVTLEDRARGVSLGTYDVSKTFAWGGVYGAATKLTDIEEGFADAVVAVLLGDTPEPPASSTAVPAAAPTAPASRSLEERLNELDALKAAGKITEEEYATLRRRVIDSHR
jgi:hypothetical protein